METLTKLTPHEQRLIGMVAGGKTDAQIGRSVHKTENAIQQDLHRLRNKLGCSNRAELVSFAYQNNLI